MLAGISADYYLRLERGSNRNPSVQVLDSIARVLRLDDDNSAYLFELVAEKPRRKRRHPREETVPSRIVGLVESLPHPAFVEGRYLDVLASNSLARALSPRLAVGGNQLRDVFLDPGEIALCQDWDAATECLITGFRQSLGTEVDDPRLVDLVGELSMASPRFRHLWARHEVKKQRGTSMGFNHPVVGELHMHRDRLAIADAEGLMLVVYHPVMGTGDAEKLALLGSFAMDAAAPREHRAGQRSR